MTASRLTAYPQNPCCAETVPRLQDLFQHRFCQKSPSCNWCQALALS